MTPDEYRKIRAINATAFDFHEDNHNQGKRT